MDFPYDNRFEIVKFEPPQIWLSLVGTGSRWRDGVGYLPPGRSPTDKVGVLGYDGIPKQKPGGGYYTKEEAMAIVERDARNRQDELTQKKKELQGEPFNNKNYQQSLAKNEDSIRKNGYETAIVLDGAGNVVLNVSQGVYGSVSFSREEFYAMRGNVVTHNHPNDSSFSPADLKVLFGSRAAEMRAAGDSGLNYSARLNPNFTGWNGLDYQRINDKIDSSFNRELQKQRSKMQELYNRGDVSTLEEFNLGMFHMTNKRLASRKTNPFEYSVSGDAAQLAKLKRLERLMEGK